MGMQVCGKVIKKTGLTCTLVKGHSSKCENKPVFETVFSDQVLDGITKQSLSSIKIMGGEVTVVPAGPMGLVSPISSSLTPQMLGDLLDIMEKGYKPSSLIYEFTDLKDHITQKTLVPDELTLFKDKDIWDLLTPLFPTAPFPVEESTEPTPGSPTETRWSTSYPNTDALPNHPHPWSKEKGFITHEYVNKLEHENMLMKIRLESQGKVEKGLPETTETGKAFQKFLKDQKMLEGLLTDASALLHSSQEHMMERKEWLFRADRIVKLFVRYLEEKETK